MADILPKSRITALDVEIASSFYPVLVELARAGRTGSLTTYKELIERALQRDPHNMSLQSCIPLSVGRRLDVIRHFTDELGIPDLTCLVVNQDTGECGSGFTDHFDPEQARERVYEYDWSTVDAPFHLYAERSRAELKRRPVKRDLAINLIAAYYKEHKSSLPKTISSHRDALITRVMGGQSVGEAFKETAETISGVTAGS